MKEWVTSFLWLLWNPELQSEESFRCEIEQVPFVWRRVSQLFMHQFESEGMEQLLGSVLVDLPKEEFDLIRLEKDKEVEIPFRFFKRLAQLKVVVPGGLHYGPAVRMFGQESLTDRKECDE